MALAQTPSGALRAPVSTQLPDPMARIKQAAMSRLGGAQQVNPATGRNPYRNPIQAAALRKVGGM